MTFDAAKEATKIENMAKTSLDAKSSDSIQASVNLAQELLSLTPQQRQEVAKSLTAQYDNHSFDTLPIPKIEYDKSGQVTAIDFSASALDFNNRVPEIRAAIIKPATGGEVAEIQSRQSGEKSFKQLEGIAFDSEKTERTTKSTDVKAAGGLLYSIPEMPDYKPGGPGNPGGAAMGGDVPSPAAGHTGRDSGSGALPQEVQKAKAH
ncbi:MAG: hypothetical protein JST89_00205 [Cyanobacteria bacterium SZAS-4]|nr:hypothetical protein [Cyanobacteria bacterium SZAS-4]